MPILLDVVGWKLEAARTALMEDESTRVLPVCIIETAPPPRTKREALEPSVEAARFGDWRVLRCCVRDEQVELTVAREQIVD